MAPAAAPLIKFLLERFCFIGLHIPLLTGFLIFWVTLSPTLQNLTWKTQQKCLNGRILGMNGTPGWHQSGRIHFRLARVRVYQQVQSAIK
jgi:hypothetical protein